MIDTLNTNKLFPELSKLKYRLTIKTLHLTSSPPSLSYHLPNRRNSSNFGTSDFAYFFLFCRLLWEYHKKGRFCPNK